MNNNDLKEKWSKITDLREATAELLEYQHFLGYDPYYSDMREGLLNMMARASETFECRVCKGIPDAPMMKNELTDWTQNGNTVSAKGETRSELRSLQAALNA